MLRLWRCFFPAWRGSLIDPSAAAFAQPAMSQAERVRACTGWGICRGHTPRHGYEPTREAAMAAFAKGWRRE